MAPTRALVIGLALLLTVPARSSGFIRGDLDGGGVVDIADAVSLLATLFSPGAPPFDCADAADTNDDGVNDISDAIYLLAALFAPGSPPPPPPYPADGLDLTPDSLPPCGVQGLLPITTLSQGPVSGVMTSTFEIISDGVALVNFWSLHSSGPPPAVDFATEMVVVVLQPWSSTGVTYNIDEIEVIGSTIEVRYTAVYPGVLLLVPSQPHHVVRTTAVPGTPVFIETVIALP